MVYLHCIKRGLAMARDPIHPGKFLKDELVEMNISSI